MQLCTKFEVHNFNHINDLAFNAQKFRGSRDVGYAHFLTFSLLVLEELPTCNFAPNLKFIALLISEICVLIQTLVAPDSTRHGNKMSPTGLGLSIGLIRGTTWFTL